METNAEAEENGEAKLQHLEGEVSDGSVMLTTTQSEDDYKSKAKVDDQ